MGSTWLIPTGGGIGTGLESCFTGVLAPPGILTGIGEVQGTTVIRSLSQERYAYPDRGNYDYAKH